MKLRIYTVEDPEVRKVSSEVDSSTIAQEEMQEFFDELVEMMLTSDGIGIAAPQVGRNDRIIVISKEFALTPDHQVLINPTVSSVSKKTTIAEEGCLSVPGIEGKVERPYKARVKAITRDGNPIDIKAKGMYARILLHEIDHLDGILFIDNMLP